MMSVRKSPNMMSTIGRSPAIAAPTPRPVNPASEIGVSMMRSWPNSLDQPLQHLERGAGFGHVLAERPTRGSRPISSAIASRIASPKVSSRTDTLGDTAISGIDVFVDFATDRDRAPRSQTSTAASISSVSSLRMASSVARRPASCSSSRCVKQRDGIALRSPSAAPLPSAGSRRARCRRHGGRGSDRCCRAGKLGPSPWRARSDSFGCRGVHGPHVLPVERLGRDSECRRPRAHLARGRLRAVRVLVVADCSRRRR